MISVAVYDPFVVTWAELIRRTWKESGRSLLSLSKASGVGYGRVHNFIKSDSRVSLDNAEKIARTLNLELKPKQSAKKR
jgi:Helix-turn-helix